MAIALEALSLEELSTIRVQFFRAATLGWPQFKNRGGKAAKGTP